MFDRMPHPSRTADERPRDRKRTPRAKSATLARKQARQRKFASQGRTR